MSNRIPRFVARSQRPAASRLLCVAIASVGFFASAAFGAPGVPSSIVADGSMGKAGPLAGPSYVIPQSLGTTSGNNLFHSFTTFNINTGETATFTGANNIHNIFSRVTGGTATNINGALISNIPGANLYLINPSGIMFGPGASLNVQGSFTASTAQVINFPDGTSLPTDTATTPSVLSGLDPSSYGFTTAANPVTSTNITLSVPAGKSLNLIGGDNIISGTYLTTVGGHINIVSAGPNTTVTPASDTLGTSVSGTTSSLRITDSKITTDSDTLGTSGSSSIVAGHATFTNTQISNANNGTGSSGGIDLLLGGGLDADLNSRINTSTNNSTAAGDVTIGAAYVHLTNNTNINSSTSDTGTGGKITINAPDMLMASGSSITTSTTGTGTGGLVNLNITSNLSLDGPGTGITTLAGSTVGPIVDAPGKFGGPIVINAPVMTMDHQAAIASITTSAIQGGQIRITTQPLGIVSPASPVDTSLSNGATISSFSNTAAQTGSITLEGNTINITGSGTAITSRTQSSDLGSGSPITILADNSIALSNNAVIASSAQGNSVASSITLRAINAIAISNGASINSLVSGNSSATDITLQAPSVAFLSGGAIISQTVGSGSGATVNIGADTLLADGQGADTDSNVHPSGISTLTGTQFELSAINSSITGPITAPGFHLSSSSTGTIVPVTSSNTGAAGAINLYGYTANGIAFPASSTPTPFEEYFGVASLNLSNNAIIESYTNSAGNAGAIHATLAGTSLVSLSNGSQIRSFSNLNGAPGAITLESDGSPTVSRQLLIQNLTDPTLLTGIQSIAAGSLNPAPGISISVDNIHLVNGGFIRSTTTGGGNAPDINIQSSDLTLASNISGGHSNIMTWGTEMGGPGAITIHSTSVTIDSGSQIFSNNNGSNAAPAINITATGPIVMVPGAANPQAVQGVYSNATGSGSGADINIAAGDFSSAGFSYLSSSTSGLGSGGNISLIATPAGSSLGRISLNFNADPSTPPGIITTSSSTFPTFAVVPPAQTTSGKAGTINLHGARVYLDQGAYIQSLATGQGQSGNITVSADPEYVLLNNNSHIDLSSNTNGGDILLTSPNGIFILNSMVTAMSPNGTGSNITLNSTGKDTIINSSILATAIVTGAQITIDPTVITIQNSIIRGILNGNILQAFIDPNAVFITDVFNSPYIASSTSGLTVNTSLLPVTSISTSSVISITQASTNSTANSAASGTTGQANTASPRLELNFIQNRFLNLNATLQETCGIRLMDDSSTFILTGSGGLPVDPRGYLPGYLINTPTSPSQPGQPGAAEHQK